MSVPFLMLDGHCHLNPQFSNCREAAQNLYQEASQAGIQKIILLNVPGINFGNQRGFENTEFLESIQEYSSFFHPFPGVNPLQSSALNEIAHYAKYGVSGIKLHPRLHQYSVEHPACIEAVQLAGVLGLPVMICGFMDWLNLKLNNSPEAYGRLAELASQTRIALGHAGGHRILDCLMIAKACPNLYLDLSFSLLYFRQSHLPQDIGYAIQSLKGKRIFWGSDYPDRSYHQTIQMSLDMIQTMNLENSIQQLVFRDNILKFLGSLHES
ncbi:amidohydrolase family protein [Deltaproteobacteria bacterium TL4]